METAVVSVIYPEVAPYLGDFLRSLSRQTNRDFTLYLVNDGFVGVDVFLRQFELRVIIMEKSGTPAYLRKFAIEMACAGGVKALIFADADDYFAENRVEVSLASLADHEIVCNELLLIGEGIPTPELMLGPILDNGQKISPERLMNGNCLGLSNTAMRVSAVRRELFVIPDKIVAFDWTFFSLVLHGGGRAVFTDKTQTYYRQHRANTASPRCLSSQQILRGVEVKREHYRFLSGIYREYGGPAETFEKLSDVLHRNKVFCHKYCEAVRQRGAVATLWWEPMKSAEELGL